MFELIYVRYSVEVGLVEVSVASKVPVESFSNDNEAVISRTEALLHPSTYYIAI